MLKTVDLEQAPQYLPQLKRLYQEAFPAAERLPLGFLRRLAREHGAFLLFLDGEQFCGFAHYIRWQDICYILFLAIEPKLRGKGLGTELLAILRETEPKARLLLEIEHLDPQAANFQERRRRKQFYLNNGYAETGIFFQIRGVEYELLINGGKITEPEFWTFVKSFFP